MERGFYNEDFDLEDLLKQKSDQLKMYPSDKVWKGIHANLHSTRRWYWLSLVLFLTGVSYYAADQLIATPKKQTAQSPESAQQDPKNLAQHKAAPGAIIIPFKPVLESTANTNGPLQSSTAQQEPVSLIADNSPAATFTNPAAPVLFLNAASRMAQNQQGTESLHQLADQENTIHTEITDQAAINIDEPALLPEAVPVQAVLTDAAKAEDEQRINWLQENAVYELTRPKLKRVSWQVSLTPTMNYRNLVGNENVKLASDVKNIPIALNFQGNIDNLLNHKPAVGFEVGSAFLYQLNKKLTFKTGAQFSYSRYNIQAYRTASTERATIALSNFYGSQSITTFTRLRNFGGSSSASLKNEFFQLSTPIGLEYVLLGKGRLQLAVAGTIQPTYLLNRNNYLITTDYKNYTREPSLVRRWNANTSVEAFISYKAGGLKFQVGPQFRYQLLSTYADKYPVKEFLKEYGVKLAVSKAIH